MAQTLSKPYLAAFVALAFCAGILWVGLPQRSTMERQSGDRSATAPQQDVASVPRQLGLWTGKPLEVAERTRDILETDNVAMMEYHLGKEPPLWFSQVAGFGNRASFHPPELCYVGSHFEVLERGQISVFVNGQPRRLMRLVLGQGKERFETWYWFTANDRVTPNYYQQQAWLLLDIIKRKPISGTLVRISTPVDDPGHASRRLLAFVTSWDSLSNSGDTHGS